MNSVTEFTSEANPDELSSEKLQVLFDGGVNRLSMGVQSFDQGLLQKSDGHIVTSMCMKQLTWLKKSASKILVLI